MSIVQLLVPLVVGFSLLQSDTHKVHLENAGLIWVLPILIATLGICSEQLVAVSSRRGSVQACAFVTNSVKPGEVFTPMRYER